MDKKALVAFFLVVASIDGALANPPGTVIDFKDLQRAGRPVVKNYPIAGLQAESKQWFEQFTGDDSQERRDFAAAMRGSAGQSSGGPSWRVEEDKKVVANGWRREITIRCINGRRSGETGMILVLSSGRYQYVYATAIRDSFDQAAQEACQISK